MHCSAKMRMTLQQAREGLDIGEDWKEDSHWPHCFDYMRSVSPASLGNTRDVMLTCNQTIMCYGDGTLEDVSLQPGPQDYGTFVRVIDGGDDLRYCRDTKPIYELVRQYGPNSRYGYQAKDDDFQVAPGK